MAFWDGDHIVEKPDEPYFGYPGWTLVDCGCCNGIRWGGETPEECCNCQGGGYYARHEATGTLALYPGGPLCGREPKLKEGT